MPENGRWDLVRRLKVNASHQVSHSYKTRDSIIVICI